MQSNSRLPLSVLNSSERPQKSDKPMTFIKHTKNNSCPISDLETFLQEIDRLQSENIKLKEQAVDKPIVTKTGDQNLLIQNQELKCKLEQMEMKLASEEKLNSERIRELQDQLKNETQSLRQALDQKDLKHKQALRQEQLQFKKEMATYQSQVIQLSTSDNKYQSMVQVMEQEVLSLRKANSSMESKLQTVIQNFDIQSKDQEFTLLKQHAVITSQENHLSDLKKKIQVLKDSFDELQVKYKQVNQTLEEKTKSEFILKDLLSQAEGDLKHQTETYAEHRDQQQARVEELQSQCTKLQEQVLFLQQQFAKDNEIVKRLQQNLENEQTNRVNEVAHIHRQKKDLITFLETELVTIKEQNQQLRSSNSKLETQNREVHQHWQFQFRELEAKTNALAEELTRQNKTIRVKEDELTHQKGITKALEDKTHSFEALEKDVQQLDDLLESRDQEITILKQQNDSLVNDLAKQSENLRHLSQQNKTLSKNSEELKLSNITINELQSKCDIMDKEIERLRQKVLEKSSQIEKIQKENADLQCKMKQMKLR